MTILLSYAIFLTLVSSSIPASSNPMCALLIVMIIIIVVSGIIVVKNMAYESKMVIARPTRSPDSTGSKKTSGFIRANNTVGAIIMTP
jgi:hypothetical protein